MTAISENLLLSVRNKKSHETRFYKILNALSDNGVEWRFFRETLRFLCIPELEDIVEERNSKNNCGYVLCDYTINIHPTAVISLNVSKRKIFNISNRKKFCSDWCYGAHKHILSQLPDEPMWLDKKENMPKIFELYPKNSPGCGGEIIYDDKPVSNSVAINSTEQSVMKQNGFQSNEPLLKNCAMKNQLNQPIKSDERIEKIQNVIKSLDKLVVKKSKNIEDVIKKIKDNSEKKKDRKTMLIDEYLNDKDILIPSTEENIFTDLKKVKIVICDWITEKTRDYICGSFNNGLDEEDYNGDDDSEVEENNEKIIYDEDIQPMSLPTLDSSNQIDIRRHILIKKAKAACVPLIADFDICRTNFMIEFERFINTCRLTSTNIVFSSKEFKCLIIILVDLLSSKFGNLKNVNRAQILKKYGIVQLKLYDKILMDINNTISQPLDLLVSSQGDNSYL